MRNQKQGSVQKPVVPIKKVKRLFWDIEVSPNIGLFWRGGFDQNINPDQIIVERKVITIAYKWQGDKKVHVLKWDREMNDYEMLKQFQKVAIEADELIAHYGDRFDVPWFKARCIILGLPPLPMLKTIDTKAWASKHFYFNSNKLDYLAKVFGFEGKIKTDYEMWKSITLYNSKESLDKMCKYNAEDVVQLEKVYDKFAPWMRPKTHAGVLGGHEKWTCPYTGSTNVKKSKTRVTYGGVIQHQMQNLETGSYYTISKAAYDEYLKARKKVRR